LIYLLNSCYTIILTISNIIIIYLLNSCYTIILTISNMLT
jgi:hypothetical protein